MRFFAPPRLGRLPGWGELLFQGGASYDGVSDAAAVARDTHKFEAHYLDWLIGPYPEEEARYRERSPVYHTEA
jgi:dipeptidyl aminopeptidase/acylaminoacyl peptidase